MRNAICIGLVFTLVMAELPFAHAMTKGLSQIVTPDLQEPGDLSLSLQIQDKRIANPYELQAEMGLTKWAEFAVFRGFDPDDWIFGTEFGLLTKEPYLLSIGFVNWSPHLDVDPQPYIEAGYYTEHNKFIVGGIHAGYKNEAILGYAYDFNKTWRVQVDFQSGAEDSSTIGFTWNITPDFQMNPAIYFANYHPERIMATWFSPTPFIFGGRTRAKIKTKVPGNEALLTSCENFDDAANLQDNERCSARARRLDAINSSAAHHLCDVRHNGGYARADLYRFSGAAIADAYAHDRKARRVAGVTTGY